MVTAFRGVGKGANHLPPVDLLDQRRGDEALWGQGREGRPCFCQLLRSAWWWWR